MIAAEQTANLPDGYHYLCDKITRSYHQSQRRYSTEIEVLSKCIQAGYKILLQAYLMPRFSSPTILSDDIRIIPGIEIPPDKLGVYKNKIKVVDLNNRGNFIPNVNGQGYSTIFSKSRSEERIEEEVSYDYCQ